MKECKKEKDRNPLRLNSPFVYKDIFIITHFIKKEKRYTYG